MYYFFYRPAQPLLRQLSLTRRHGAESDALREQHLVEHGQPLSAGVRPRQARQVRPSENIWGSVDLLWAGAQETLWFWMVWSPIERVDASSEGHVSNFVWKPNQRGVLACGMGIDRRGFDLQWQIISLIVIFIYI